MNSESSNSLVGVNDDPSSPRSFCHNLIYGENVQFLGTCTEAQLTLTNYRMIMQMNGFSHTVPLGVIERTEIRNVTCLHIHCKDARSYKCSFPTGEACLNWQKRINDAIAMPSTIERVFAFTFYHATLIENSELNNYFSSHMGGYSSYIQRSNKIFDDEIKRLGFDLVGSWRISLANENYQLCPSYPRRIIVPSSISDSTLEACAKFRSSKRIPTVVWRHPNGAVIARCSQPEVGWFWWRSIEDENLVKAMSEACAYDSPTPSSQLQICSNSDDSHNKSELALSDLSSICDLPEAKSQADIKSLLIMDARSYGTAVANRARGGGCECLEYYQTCEILFMNLENIHVIRKSHQALRNLASSPLDTNWLPNLENTKWLHHISGLIKAAVTVAQTIVAGRPVLVHCSDGWDRTPQITALAEILLDPYYRTLDGFQVLVEREWIEFGHKFSDRCGSGIGSEDVNERCPVFLQWIDCVHQILNQFPTVFQFNQAYLVKLAQHVNSCLFGTFLFNSSQERYKLEQLHGKTIPFPVWPLFKLHQHRYTNYLYCNSNQVLYPSYHIKDLALFKAVYLNNIGDDDLKEKHLPSEEVPESNASTEHSVEGELVKTKSCDNLLKSNLSLNCQVARRSSDPNLRETYPDMALLKSALGSETFEENSCSLPHLDREPLASTISDKERIICKDNKLKSVISLSHSTEEHNLVSSENGYQEMNGAPKFYIEDDDSGCENTKEDSLQKVKDADKRSIEGSTDTLVAELGVLSVEEIPKAPQHGNYFSSKSSKLSVNGIKSADESSSRKVMSNGKSGLSYRAFIPEERAHDEAQNCYVASSVAACSICLKSKKFLNDTPTDLDIWKYSNTDEVVSPPSLMNGVAECKAWKGGQFCTPNHSNSNSSCIPSTPSEERYMMLHQEKTLSSTFSDGLSNYSDDMTKRLNQMRLQHQMEVDNLKRELQATKNFYLHLLHTQKSHANGENHTEDQVSLPESVGSGSGDSVGPESSGLSDASWEALEEGDGAPTLWVPDHAVDSCMGCQSRFWIGRRKHHCRSCGKIFCAECSGNSVPIPEENLFDPVRVCGSCFSSLLEFRPKYIQVASN